VRDEHLGGLPHRRDCRLNNRTGSDGFGLDPKKKTIAAQ